MRVVGRVLWMLALALALPLGAARAQGCVGDCDANGAVTVDELVVGANIGLGGTPLSSCPALDAVPDGAVTIDELVVAVGNALAGCPATPTPPAPTASASATAPPSESPTATPTAPVGTASATPTVPAVGGAWLEDSLAVVSSNCVELLTDEFAAELAARPPCEQRVTATGAASVTVVDCTGNAVDGALGPDGTLHLVHASESDTVEGCTVTLDTSASIAAAASPTTAHYEFRISFAGSCPLNPCVITAQGTWTRVGDGP